MTEDHSKYTESQLAGIKVKRYARYLRVSSASTHYKPVEIRVSLSLWSLIENAKEVTSRRGTFYVVGPLTPGTREGMSKRNKNIFYTPSSSPVKVEHTHRVLTDFGVELRNRLPECPNCDDWPVPSRTSRDRTQKKTDSHELSDQLLLQRWGKDVGVRVVMSAIPLGSTEPEEAKWREAGPDTTQLRRMFEKGYVEAGTAGVVFDHNKQMYVPAAHGIFPCIVWRRSALGLLIK